jgi:hypothetical protein
MDMLEGCCQQQSESGEGVLNQTECAEADPFSYTASAQRWPLYLSQPPLVGPYNQHFFVSDNHISLAFAAPGRIAFITRNSGFSVFKKNRNA